MTLAIEMKKLCCKAGYRFLLKDIDWQVEQGDHWVIFGMNGCGKTTLLSIVAGVHAQTSGTVKIFGEEYTQNNILKLRKKIVLLEHCMRLE